MRLVASQMSVARSNWPEPGLTAVREQLKGLTTGRHAWILKFGQSLHRAQVGARESVVPGEFVLVPHHPKEAHEKSPSGKHVAGTAQQHLPGRGRLSGKADDL